ncbi:MAG: phage holin family protein [Marmoricola sp.]
MNQPMDDLIALTQRVWASFLGRSVHRFIRMEGIDRCLVLSSQAFTALIPLLIVVSAVVPPGGPEVVANTIINKFGLSGSSAESVEQLFAIDGAAESTLGVGSAILLLYSGVSFTRRLQKMYRAAWNRQKAGVRGNMFAALALIVFLAEVLVVYAIMSLVHSLPTEWLLALPLAILTGFVPWTSVPYLLMDREVHWRRLLVTGGLTSVSMSVYGTATTLYMPEMIEVHTSEFGLFGVTIAIIGWLLGAAGIVIASTAVGAEFDQCRAPWALRLKERYRLWDPRQPAPTSLPADDASSLTGADLLLLFRVLVTWSVMAVAVWVATALVPGVEVEGGAFTYLWLSLLLGLVNALIGPLLRFAVADLTWPRLGLVALVVNGVLLEITSWLTENLATDGLVSSVVGGLVISVAISLYEFALRPFHPHGMSRGASAGAESGGDSQSE